MRFKEISIEKVLNYDHFEMNFGEEKNGLHIIYGPNEAGKSTLLEVLVDILFGGKIQDTFKNHYNTKSILKATLESGNEQITIQRKRKRSKLELVDTDITEEFLLQWLGGFNREQFALLFGFDHERLRKGGKSLLESEGHAGISLFETGGGVQFLQNLFKELSERSEKLLDPNFRARSAKIINRLWQNYKDAEKEIQSVSLRGDDWKRLKLELEEKGFEQEQLQKEKLDLLNEKAKLERIQRVRSLVGTLKDLKEKLNHSNQKEILTDELDKQIETSLDTYQQCLKQLDDEKTRYNNKLIKLKSIQTDPMVLKHEHEIHRLNEALQQYRSRKWEEIPEEKVRLTEKQTETELLLKEIHPEKAIADAEQLRIPSSDIEQIQELAEDMKIVETERNNLQERFEEIQTDLMQARDKLATVGEPKNVKELEVALKEIRNRGDLEGSLEKLKNEIAEKRAELTKKLSAQTLWKKSLEELLTTPFPINETRERYLREWTNLEDEIKETEKNLEQLQQDLDKVNFELKMLEAGGPVPIEEDLKDARAHRDFGWTLIKDKWLEGKTRDEDEKNFAGEKPLAEAYEQAVKKTDEIADLMRKESDRSARRAHYLLQVEKLNNDIAKTEKLLSEKKNTFAELKERWQKEWAPSGIEPLTPLEMKEWLTLFYQPMTDGISELQKIEQEYSYLLKERDSYIEQLKKMLVSQGIFTDKEAPATPSLKTLLIMIEDYLDQTRRQQMEFEHAKNTVKDLENRFAHHKDKLQTAKEKLVEKQEAWNNWRKQYPALPEPIHIAVNYIEKLKELFYGLAEINRLQQSIKQKEEECVRFEEAVRLLADCLEEDLSSTGIEEFVRYARNRLDLAKKAKAEYDTIYEETNQLKDNVQALENEVAKFKEEIQSYLEKYQCADEEALRHMVERSKEFKQLDQARKEKEMQLQETGDFLPIAQLEKEVEEAEAFEVVAEKIVQLEEEIENLEKRIQQLTENISELKLQFEAMDGSQSDAAVKAQEAEEYLAEIDQYWTEYLRVEMARRLLQRAIDEFREKNESNVIERAGLYFKKLTLGRYEGIGIEYEGNEPYIEALGEDGINRRVPELSDGTRDQLFLALRLAFIEQQLEQAEPIPLIIDDILVNFDDDRTIAALEIFQNLAEKTQVLYFTHHKSIVEYANRLPNRERVKIHDLLLYKEGVVS